MPVDFGLSLLFGPPQGQTGKWLADLDVSVPALEGHFRSLWMTDHFEISEGLIIGKTPEGRVTVHILLMNQSERVEVRKILIDAGLW